MKTISFEELYHTDFSLKLLNVPKQNWAKRDFYSCIGRPKESCMFLYFGDPEAKYVTKNGEKLRAAAGDLVYIPTGSEYVTYFFEQRDSDRKTTGINFRAYDAENQPIRFSTRIEIFHGIDFLPAIRKAENTSELIAPCYSEVKAAVYDLITLVSRTQRRKATQRFQIIEKGIDYLEGDPLQELSIREVAAMCNVSDTYFRRLFKEYSGRSPIDYRIMRKIEKAKTYMQYDNLNISELAESLKFRDTAYFCKQFKLYTGVTPLKYKQNLNAEQESTKNEHE